MDLPLEFLNRMRAMLGDEFPAWEASFKLPKVQGLRANTLKISAGGLNSLLPFELERVPWCACGFYYQNDARPGKSPFHDAGLFYMQEPSAMLPAELLAAAPGERVLDLCAAPGGKTTQIASGMEGSGLLVANEPYHARAKVLSQNIERLGITNAVVTCAMPDKLADNFHEFFDKIMVDAPCSGEGMFRKDEDTRAEWSEEIVSMCAARQWEILQSAHSMLRPGGRMVYSTCTFSPDENEKIVARLISEYGMRVIKCSAGNVSDARPEWADGNAEISSALRIWPHISRGEGHFTALLEKAGESSSSELSPFIGNVSAEYTKFHEDTFNTSPLGATLAVCDELYVPPTDMSLFSSIHVLRAGLHLGTVKKNRFEPSHALALASSAPHLLRVRELLDDEVIKYLRGETLPADCGNGWALVTYKSYPLGWGKVSDKTLKNHYPKGLRRMSGEI